MNAWVTPKTSSEDFVLIEQEDLLPSVSVEDKSDKSDSEDEETRSLVDSSFSKDLFDSQGPSYNIFDPFDTFFDTYLSPDFEAAFMDKLCKDLSLDPRDRLTRLPRMPQSIRTSAATIYDQMLAHLLAYAETAEMSLSTDLKQVATRNSAVVDDIAPDALFKTVSPWQTEERWIIGELSSEGEAVETLVKLERACLVAVLSEEESVSADYLTNISSVPLVLSRIGHARLAVSNMRNHESELRVLVLNCDFFFHLRILLCSNRLKLVDVHKTIKDYLIGIEEKLSATSGLTKGTTTNANQEIRQEKHTIRQELKKEEVPEEFKRGLVEEIRNEFGAMTIVITVSVWMLGCFYLGSRMIND